MYQLQDLFQDGPLNSVIWKTNLKFYFKQKSESRWRGSFLWREDQWEVDLGSPPHRRTRDAAEQEFLIILFPKSRKIHLNLYQMGLKELPKMSSNWYSYWNYPNLCYPKMMKEQETRDILTNGSNKWYYYWIEIKKSVVYFLLIGLVVHLIPIFSHIQRVWGGGGNCCKKVKNLN